MRVRIGRVCRRWAAAARWAGCRWPSSSTVGALVEPEGTQCWRRAALASWVWPARVLRRSGGRSSAAARRTPTSRVESSTFHHMSSSSKLASRAARYSAEPLYCKQTHSTPSQRSPERCWNSPLSRWSPGCCTGACESTRSAVSTPETHRSHRLQASSLPHVKFVTRSGHKSDFEFHFAKII